MSRAAGAMLWATSAAVAVAAHLVLVQQGLAAYGAQTLAPPPEPRLLVEVMIVPNAVAAPVPEPVPEVAPEAEMSVETPLAVAPQTLAALSDPARLAASAAPQAARLAPSAARLVPVQPIKPAAPPAQARNADVAALLASRPAPLIPVPQATSVTPTRPTAPLATAVKSAAPVAVRPVVTRPGLTPPAIAPVAVAPQAVAVVPFAVAPQTVVPIAVAPLAVAPPTLAPPTIAPSNTSPIAAAPSLVAQTATVPATVRATVSVAGAGRVAASVVQPNAVVPVPPPSPPAQDGIAAPAPAVPIVPAQDNAQTYQSVLDVLANLPKSPCFAALPTLSDQSAFQLEVFAQSEGELTAFADDLAAGIGQTPNTTMRAISAAQCAAASFITEGPAYPRFKLFLDIDRRDIQSGEMLEGRIGNSGGGILSFLVIDDDGLVQDLASFLQFARGEARFAIPLSLTGSPVVTQQLLMALSTPSLPQTVLSMNGAKAEDFFPALAAELRAKGQSEDVALIAFSVE